MGGRWGLQSREKGEWKGGRRKVDISTRDGWELVAGTVSACDEARCKVRWGCRCLSTENHLCVLIEMGHGGGGESSLVYEVIVCESGVYVLCVLLTQLQLSASKIGKNSSCNSPFNFPLGNMGREEVYHKRYIPK
jgi:hypothetical protein